MTNQTMLPTSPRVIAPQRPLHLRSLARPLSRAEAIELFARQQAAEAFGRICA